MRRQASSPSPKLTSVTKFIFACALTAKLTLDFTKGVAKFKDPSSFQAALNNPQEYVKRFKKYMHKYSVHIFHNGMGISVPKADLHFTAKIK